MKRETYSEEYRTVRNSYPSEWNFACPSCGEKVRFRYPDDGKLIHTLEGLIYQIVNLYSCTNGECEFSKIVFNPCPRFDYSQRTYGADVFRLIAEEYLIYELKPNQIHKRLTKKYQLKISKDTIRRICDDILKLKSLKIDEKTLEIIRKQGHILLGFDGQDPGGDAPSIWCFMDLISNRVLATYKFDTLDYKKLHQTIDLEIIELIRQKIKEGKETTLQKLIQEFNLPIMTHLFHAKLFGYHIIMIKTERINKSINLLNSFLLENIPNDFEREIENKITIIDSEKELTRVMNKNTLIIDKNLNIIKTSFKITRFENDLFKLALAEDTESNQLFLMKKHLKEFSKEIKEAIRILKNRNKIYSTELLELIAMWCFLNKRKQSHGKLIKEFISNMEIEDAKIIANKIIDEGEEGVGFFGS